MKDFQFYFEVVRVVDGDTIAGIIDRGWDDWKGTFKRPIRCRIADIAASELNVLEGQNAKAFAQTIVPVGMTFKMISHAVDDWGRPLVTLEYPDGTSFSQKMIESGHAIPYNKLLPHGGGT